MGYEKKIEPLTRTEVFLSGFTLQLFIFIYFIFPGILWGNSCLSEFAKDFNELSDDEFYTSAHKCFTNMRNEVLAVFSCFLLCFPIIVAHVYYYGRIGDTLSSWLSIGLLRAIYRGAWGITTIIFCVIIPSLGIFIFYYDWELSNVSNDINTSSNYLITGYRMQFEFFQFTNILWDCGYYPLGFVATIPWISGMIVMLNIKFFDSKNWLLSKQAKEDYILKFMMPGGNKYCYVCFFSIIISICLFGSLGATLDYSKNGFWKYGGDAFFLWILLFFAFELQAIILIGRSFKLHQHQQFLDKNVKARN